jgi:hypothetical protein
MKSVDTAIRILREWIVRYSRMEVLNTMRIAVQLLATILVSASLFAADFAGTWKLNLEKSKLEDSTVASETMTITPTGPNAYRTSIDTVLKSGKKEHAEIDRTYDGQERPIQGVANPQGSTEKCELLDPSTRKVTRRKDGQLVFELISTVSADGTVLTNTRTTGKHKDVLVFERP